MQTTIDVPLSDQVAELIREFCAARDAKRQASPLAKRAPEKSEAPVWQSVLLARWTNVHGTEYLWVLALYALTIVATQSVGIAFSIVLFYVPVWWAIRRFSAGPRWLSFFLTLGAIAWVLPPMGSFAVSVEYVDRYLANAAALVMLMFSRTSTFRPMLRRFGGQQASSGGLVGPESNRRAASWRTRNVSSSSFINPASSSA